MSLSAAAHPLLSAQTEAMPACSVYITGHHVHSLQVFTDPNDAKMPNKMHLVFLCVVGLISQS